MAVCSTPPRRPDSFFRSSARSLTLSIRENARSCLQGKRTRRISDLRSFVLTSYTPSTARRSRKTGEPMTGVDSNNPALPIKILRNAAVTRANCRTISTVKLTSTGATYFAVSIRDHVSIAAGSNGLHAIHSRDVSNRSRYDFLQPFADLGKWPLVDNDQWTIDQTDALCWCLKSLRSFRELLDSSDNFSRGSHSKLVRPEKQKCRLAKIGKIMEAVVEILHKTLQSCEILLL